MAAQLIDGKKISQQRIEAVAQAVKARQEKGLYTPCLGGGIGRRRSCQRGLCTQ